MLNVPVTPAFISLAADAFSLYLDLDLTLDLKDIVLNVGCCIFCLGCCLDRHQDWVWDCNLDWVAVYVCVSPAFHCVTYRDRELPIAWIVSLPPSEGKKVTSTCNLPRFRPALAVVQSG